jgi:hypothetical protein
MTNETLQWFRLYHRIIDDEKIRLLAFEDRWHFIAICCLKADGLLDEPDTDLKWRKVAVKLGVQLRELDEIKRRLSEVGLVDDHLTPNAWDRLQYRSDTSTDRVRKFREKQRVKPDETPRNVSVTPPDTETETDISLRDNARERFAAIWSTFPLRPGQSRKTALKAFLALSDRDQTVCMDAAKVYAGEFETGRLARRESTEKALQFVPALVRWIEGESWRQDELSPELPPSGIVVLRQDHPDYGLALAMVGPNKVGKTGNITIKAGDLEKARATA